LTFANIVMLSLLAVVGAALFGRGPAAPTAVANVLAFDFFFVTPKFSFAVSDALYLFTFAVMLVVGIAGVDGAPALSGLASPRARAGATAVRNGA
jgi:two-component system sensor histidine kinase KdpD